MVKKQPNPEQSKIGRRSRRKGKVFEREFAKKMTELTGMKWESTRNSGRTDLKGDIYCPDKPDLPVVIECKHRNEYRLAHLFHPTVSLERAIYKNDVDAGTNKTSMFVVKTEIGVFFRLGGEFGHVIVRGHPYVIECGGDVLWLSLEGVSGIEIVL